MVSWFAWIAVFGASIVHLNVKAARVTQTESLSADLSADANEFASASQMLNMSEILIPQTMPGDEQGDFLPKAFTASDFGEIQPQACSSMKAPLQLKDRVLVRNSNTSRWLKGVVTEDNPVKVLVDGWQISYSFAEIKLEHEPKTDGRVFVIPDRHYRLFLSVVAGHFGDDGEDDSFYGGDFFTTPAFSDLLRCYYSQILKDAANIIARRGTWKSFTNSFLQLAEEIEQSLLTNPLGLHATEAVMREMITLAARIRRLRPGDVVFFPCGWKGHAVYCEVQRETTDSLQQSSLKTFSLSIFNSGDGIGHHYSISHDGFSRKYSPALVFTHLPEDELLNPTQLRLIVEASATSKSRSGGSVPSDPQTMYQLGLGRLEAWLDRSRSSAVMMDSQVGGTCMLSGIHHFVHFKIRETLKSEDQETAGQAIEHALQRAALDWFTTSVQGINSDRVFPALEQFPHSEQQGTPIPFPSAAFYQLVRRKELIRTAARQVMMHDESDKEGQKTVRNLEAWLDKQIIPLPKNLHDEAGDSTSHQYFTQTDFAEPSTTDGAVLPPSARACTLPDGLLPKAGRDAAEELSALAAITLETIDRCFGETYVDWLAARVLTIDLAELAIHHRHLLSAVFFQLADMVKRFSATQPFADHIAALRRLVLKFHGLAGLSDFSRLAGSLPGSPSLKDFTVDLSFMAEEVETPQNLLFGARLPEPNLEPGGNEYLYVLASQEGDPAAKLEMMCGVLVHLPTTEWQLHNMKWAERDQKGNVGKGLSQTWMDSSDTFKFKSPEKYVIDFIEHASGNGTLLELEQVNKSDPCEICKSQQSCKGDFVRMASCVLARKAILTPVSISDDFFTVRRMLIEFHLLEHAVSSRLVAFPHILSQPAEKTEFEKINQVNVRRHFIEFRWCDIPTRSGDLETLVRERHLLSTNTRPARHPTRLSLRRHLSEPDETAMKQFLFRDARPLKWMQTEQGEWKLHHDGDNAIVLHDLSTFGTEDQLTIFQRTLFEIGVHSSLSRVQWLGHLQEHPGCFIEEACRLATDAILFSEKFNPATCTNASDTDRSYYEQVLQALEVQFKTSEAGEPSAKRLLAMSHVRITRHRVLAKLQEAPRGSESLHELQVARQGWHREVKMGATGTQAERLHRLHFTLTCMELLLLVDMHGVTQLRNTMDAKETKECTSTFMYLAHEELNVLDPAALHQAVRAHASILQATAPSSICELIGGGNFSERSFPLAQCGKSTLNMLSGIRTEANMVKVERHHLPAAVREQRFANALTRVQAEAFGYISDETFKVVMPNGDKYFLTQSTAGEASTSPHDQWKAKVLIHRQVQGKGQLLQLMEPCIWSREFKPEGAAKAKTVDTDVLALLLGADDAGSDASGDAFCWTDKQTGSVEITHIGYAGTDDLVLVGSLHGSNQVDVEVRHATAHLPESTVGQHYDFSFANLWLQDRIWKGAEDKAGATPSEAMAATGVFTRFQEGRPPLVLSPAHGGQKGCVVFPGVSSEAGVVHLIQHSPAPAEHYTYTQNEREFIVLSMKGYAPAQHYLLQHGVPHLLLTPSEPNQQKKRFVLLALPNATGSQNKEQFFGLPVRKAMILEMEDSGLLVPTNREDHLSLALIMMRVKKFEHAFHYMAGVHHLTQWTNPELFLLREMAGTAEEQRDADTSYLRLLAVKLLREECLRFAVVACHRKMGFDKDWMEHAQKAMGLALQTKHLVPAYRIVEMRTLTLTRFFSDGDLGTDPDGLRGWFLGKDRPKVDLVPRRQEFPVKQPVDHAAALLFTKDTLKEGWQKGKWNDVFPAPEVDLVEQVQAHYKAMRAKISYSKSQALLFAWLQPILPGANTILKPDETGYDWQSDQQSAYQLALLLHIYRTRSSGNSWQLEILRPLAEAWLFAKDLDKQCKNCAVIHGLLQLLLTTEPTVKIEPFEAMMKNLENVDFKSGATGYGTPVRCCSGAGSSVVLARLSEWSTHVSSGETRIQASPFEYIPLPKKHLFGTGSGAAQSLSKCKPVQKGLFGRPRSSDQLLDILLRKVYPHVAHSSKIYQSLPPLTSRLSWAGVLVALYAQGGHYAEVFPGVNEQDLHCQIHEYLLMQTREAHDAMGATRQFSFADFTEDVGSALLVFEYKTGFSIRQAQVGQLKDLVSADMSRPHIQQIMMGGGKTSVLSPMLLQTGGGLGCFMAPSGVFTQNAKDLTAKTVSVFGQRGFVLSCYRTTQQQELATLRWTLSQLQEALHLRRYVLMLPKTLQCFQNLLVMNMGAPEKYGILMQILEVLRLEATAVIDEVDTIYDPNTEVNFPLTKEDTGRDLVVMQFLAMVFTLPSYPGEQVKLKMSFFENTVKPQLVRQLIELVQKDALPFTLTIPQPERMRSISEDLLSCSETFFLAPLEGALQKDSSGAPCAVNRDMQIVHLFLQDIMPQVIKFRRNVDYGLSHLHPDQAFVIPYAFANKPVEGSKFSNYLLSVGLSFQYWFLGGLNINIFGHLIADLRKRKVRRGKSMLHMVYQHLQPIVPQLAQIPSEALQENEDLISDKILTDPAIIVCTLGLFVVPRITASASQVTNYALNMDNSLKRFVGFSGTISSGHIFPTRANIVEDSTVETRLYSRTVEKSLPGQHIFSVEEDEQEMVLALVSGNFSHTNALLDCGAFLRDFKNFAVAELVLEARSDIQAVLYYHDVQNRIMALHRDGRNIVTSKTETVLKGWKLQYKDVFLYLDQQHTVGTDMRLAADAVASLTIARKTTQEELMQAQMRMRNFQGVQYNNGKVQDVLYVFRGKAPDSLENFWQKCKRNTAKLIEGMIPTIDQRKANALHRGFYLRKQPPPSETRTHVYAEQVFFRNQDFLKPDDADKLGVEFARMRDKIPFELSVQEHAELQDIVARAVKSGAGAGPSTEEELELELEQEAELQVERLRNEENLNEDSFTNNPIQWAPLYAFCDETALPQFPRPQGLHVCAPVSSFLAGGAPAPSPVATSLAFTLLRPAPLFRIGAFVDERDWVTELNEKMTAEQKQAELLRRMQLFQEPWQLPHNDEAQPAPLNASSLLVSDYRKNVRNVAFVVNNHQPEHFQFVLITSDEALALDAFCHHLTVDDIPKKWDVFHFDGSLQKGVKKFEECEDPQRGGWKPKKDMGHRFDYWQQLALHKSAFGPDLLKVLRSFWETRSCTVFTPTALPKDYLASLLPPATLSRASPSAKRMITKALVEVLTLAGSVELLDRPEFKAEFFWRMQDSHFRETFRAVKEKMGEPIDGADLSYMRAQGRKCELQCGDGNFKFGTQVDDDGQADVTCLCARQPAID